MATTPNSPARPKKNKKLSRSVVALSASAIAAVYFAGYGATMGADSALAQQPSTAVVSSAPSSTSSASATVVAPATSSSSASAAATAAAFRDGTYSGTGYSRRGGISVSVAVQGGKISGVTITGASTEYPVSAIGSLPGEVVSSQSAQVNFVSGATFSSMAFQSAVQQALSQAAA